MNDPNGRLTYRRFEDSDVDNLFHLDNDPEVMRYLTGGEGTPRHIIQEEILPRFLEERGVGSPFGFWALALKDDGRFIGWVSLRRLPERPTAASLGYRLSRESWGRGLATEASAFMLEQGFLHSQVDLILATTYEKNIGSIRVMQKLGMRLIRTFRYEPEDLAQNDTAHHSTSEVWDGVDVEYGINRGTWIQSQAEGRHL